MSLYLMSSPVRARCAIGRCLLEALLASSWSSPSDPDSLSDESSLSTTRCPALAGRSRVRPSASPVRLRVRAEGEGEGDLWGTSTPLDR